jgi:hypothetical protein
MAQITISKPSSALWTATFNNPPINLIDPDTIGELQDLVVTLESDAEVNLRISSRSAIRACSSDSRKLHLRSSRSKRCHAAMTMNSRVVAMPAAP